MITIIGLGFVGLTTGLGFAKKGFKTFGFDIDLNRLNQLKNYNIPFFEPHLEDVLKETLGRSFFLDVDFQSAIRQSEAVFLCVGTPSKADGSADLTFLLNAIDQIIDVDTPEYQVIITKSTVPPSTVTRKVIPHVKNALKNKPGRNIGFASNPEFLREGYCWEDFIEPDRIVIGIEDEKAKNVLNKVYKPFNAPMHYVSYTSAEFIKYLSNTLLSTLISYSNEMSILASLIGDIDVPKAFRILHEDKRWFGSPADMSKYVYPGCGYGGYCLPKDTSALVSIASEYGFSTPILSANLEINKQIKHFVVDKIEKEVKKDEPIGILGLSFKPNSDDVRITPTKEIISLLLDKNFKSIYVYDPISNNEFKKYYPELRINYSDSLEDIVQKADNLIILTGWKEFIEKKDLITAKRVFDYRYIY
jgi:UDPglucose 6-dehydrogenase